MIMSRIDSGSSVRGLSEVTTGDVGVPRRDLAHDRRVCCCRDHRRRPNTTTTRVSGQRAHCGDRALERIRRAASSRPGTGSPRAVGDALEPARYAAEARLSPAGDRVAVDAAADRHPDREREVRQVEAAHQRRRDVERADGRLDPEPPTGRRLRGAGHHDVRIHARPSGVSATLSARAPRNRARMRRPSSWSAKKTPTPSRSRIRRSNRIAFGNRNSARIVP